MRQWFIFNGKSSKDFGVYISGLNTFGAPERDVDIISISGRNGDLTIDNGRYKNIDVSYPAFIFDRFDNNIEGLRNFLLSQSGYKRLEDTYHPNEYRLARYKSGLTPKVIDELYAGEFDLTFDCYPQRYLKSGDQTITMTADGSLFNEYAQIAKPIIRAYGTGSFTVGDATVTINSADDYTDIDCELQEAYKDDLTTNCNANITLDDGVFPSLISGENAITLDGITQLDIKPKWWIL